MPMSRAGYARKYGAKYAKKAWSSKYATSARRRLRTKASAYGKRAIRRRLSKRSTRRLTNSSKLSIVGHPLGTREYKTFTIHNDNGFIAYNTRTLQQTNMSLVSQQTSADEPNLRDAGRIDVIGYSYDWIFRNELTKAQWINVCFLIPTDEAGSSASFGQSTFFRGYGTLTDEQAFTTILDGKDLVYRAINADCFKILSRKRYKLSPINAATNVTEANYDGNGYKRIKGWLPIHRQYQYDGGSVTQGPDIFMVWWADSIMSNGSDAATVGGISANRTLRMLFRDTTR